MICTVGFDGTVRLCLLDTSISSGDDAKDGDAKSNIIELHNPGQQIQGCSFSRFYPLLAITCTDGFCTVYDLSFLEENATAKSNSEAGPVLQVGKFAVSEQGLFRVEFHPTIKNVMAITCDSSEVKVFRFTFDSSKTNSERFQV